MSELKEAKCPVCHEVIEIEMLSEPGELMLCPACDAELEIVSVTPPRVRALPKDEWDDYRDEEEDEDLGDY